MPHKQNIIGHAVKDILGVEQRIGRVLLARLFPTPYLDGPE